MTRRWIPRRPSPTFANLGEPLGEAISAPTREAAERIAVAKFGRPVLVELLSRSKEAARPSFGLFAPDTREVPR